MGSPVTIRAALEAARSCVKDANEESVELMVKALTAVGFDCDIEDVRGGFQELEAWALMQPPFDMTLSQSAMVLVAQRSAGPGTSRGDTRVAEAHAIARAHLEAKWQSKPRFTVRDALSRVEGMTAGSLEQIADALRAANIDCDKEDARASPFQHLAPWSLMQPPISLPYALAVAVSTAQRVHPSTAGGTPAAGSGVFGAPAGEADDQYIMISSAGNELGTVTCKPFVTQAQLRGSKVG